MKTAETKLLIEPVRFIRDRFLEKRKANPQYSIAAYARDLGLSASFLSRLLAGDRPLTVKLAVQIASVFELSSATVDEWVLSVISASGKHSKIPRKLKETLTQKKSLKQNHPIHFYDMERFKAISQWYHFAILSLTFVEGFKSDATWISKRLGISRVEANDAIERLLELGLLERREGRLHQTETMLYVDQKKPDLAIRKYHQAMCEKARLALEDASPEAFDQQYFSGISLAFDRQRMPEFKEKLKRVSQELMHSNVGDAYSDVYHLNIQLFPVTTKEKKV